MNIIDWLILLILGVSVVYGCYHGFIQAIASLVGALVSVGIAFLFGPQIAAVLGGSIGMRDLLSNITDAVVRVGDFDLASSRVAGIGASTVETVLNSVALPKPLADVLRDNLLGETLAGTGMTTVNDYVSNTIVSASLQVIGFLLCFVMAYLLFTVLINLLQHVFRFPILRQLDWLAGGVFGLARGALLTYLLLLLAPLISTAMPLEGFDALLEASALASYFGSDGLFVRIISNML